MVIGNKRNLIDLFETFGESWDVMYVIELMYDKSSAMNAEDTGERRNMEQI